MARIVEILVAVSALAGIASFLGFRALFRRTVRTLGRPAKHKETPPDTVQQIERRTPNGTDHVSGGSS